MSKEKFPPMGSLLDVRNDTGERAADVLTRLEAGGLRIQYGDIVMMAEQEKLAEAVKIVGAMTGLARVELSSQIERSLKMNLAAIESGRFSKETADNFYSDLMLREALKRSAS